MGHQTECQVSPGLKLANSHPDDAYAFGDNLRIEDEHELRVVHSMTLPVPVLLQKCIETSDQCWTILDNERRVLGFWGHGGWALSGPESGEGYVWLLSNDELFERYPVQMTRLARDHFFPQLDKAYSAFGNLVLESNTVHVRWLLSLGFKLRGTHEIQGKTFLNLMRS